MPKIEPRTLKGFPDYPPEQQLRRQAVFAKIQSVFERFGFLPLSTPALEYKEILMGKYGDEEKLIYDFVDKGGREVALRYDLTVPLARFVAQNRGKLTLPFKRYQIAPVWRAENPQRGRLREFYQCDVDVVGTESPLADAEIITCIYTALSELELTGLEIRFSNRLLFYRLLSLPDPEIVSIMRGLDKLEKIGWDGVRLYLVEQGVSAEGLLQAKKIVELGKGQEAPKNIAASFPAAADLAGPGGAVAGVIASIVQFGVPETALVFDPLLVRGLDYYTNMVFEIRLTSRPEFGSIAGGGRYDSLVDQFSEQSLPAVGGSIGIDRLLEAMGEMGLSAAPAAVQVLVINQDAALGREYVELAASLRAAGINTEMYYEPAPKAKLEKQFKYAESRGIDYAIIMGQTEREKGTVQVKNLKTREQREVARQDLEIFLKKTLS